jgi:hypothetical protein
VGVFLISIDVLLVVLSFATVFGLSSPAQTLSGFGPNRITNSANPICSLSLTRFGDIMHESWALFAGGVSLSTKMGHFSALDSLTAFLALKRLHQQ